MAIFTLQRKQQQRILWIVVLIVAATAGILYFGLRAPAPAPVASVADSLLKSEIIKEIKMNTSIFEDERFLALVPYERIKGDILAGRANPFLPY